MNRSEIRGGVDTSVLMRLLTGQPAPLANSAFAARAELDDLLWPKLPELLDAEQRKAKIHNLLSKLVRRNAIRNAGSRKLPNWVLFQTQPPLD